MDGERDRAVVPHGRHVVRTQHGVTASAGQRRGDVEIRSYLRDQAGAGVWSLTSASPMTGLGRPATCTRTGACRPQDLDAPLRIAAQRKIAAYQQQYADNLGFCLGSRMNFYIGQCAERSSFEFRLPNNRYENRSWSSWIFLFFSWIFYFFW